MKTFALLIDIDREERTILFIDAKTQQDVMGLYRGDWEYDVREVWVFDTQIPHPEEMTVMTVFEN